MSLPASDAFSLSHDTNRTRLSSSLRATSPKLPFVSSQQVRAVSQSHTADNSRKTIRPRTARERSMGDPNGFAPPSNGHATEQNGTQTQTGNGYGIKSRSRSPSKHLRRRSSSKQQAVPVVVVARSQSSSPAAVPIDWEIPRKTLHSSIGFLTLYLYFSHGSPKPVVNALGAALAVIAPADILRLNHSGFEKIYERCLGFLMRESEKKSTNGVIWYIIGVIWVLTLYPLDVAVVSILILSWADTAASTIGRLWGRYTPRLPKRFLGLPFAPRKSVAGFIAGSVTGAVIAGGFWGLYGHSGIVEPIWDWESGVAGTSGALAGWLGLGVVSIVSGLVSGVAEALDLGSADDNLTLPIISGGCLLAFFNCVRYCFS